MQKQDQLMKELQDITAGSKFKLQVTFFQFINKPLGFWGFGVLGFWGFGVLGFWKWRNEYNFST